MFKSFVGASTNPDPAAAGREAAAAVKAEDLKAAFVYASCDYDVPAVLSGVAETLPGVPVFGNTSFTGVITPEGYIGGDRPFVGILAFSDPDLTVGVAAEPKDGCSICKGKAIAGAALAAAGRTGARRFGYFANQGKTIAACVEKAAGRPIPFLTGCPAAAYLPTLPAPRHSDRAPFIRSSPRSPRRLPACPLRRAASSCPESAFG